MDNHWIRPHHPLVIAHRGFSSRAPENTLEAYRLAVDAGAEMIEADVNVTRDDQAVMIHDWHLGRTVHLDAAVHDLTLKQVRELDAGSWFGGRFSGAAIPTTDDVLKFAKAAGILMCFEVKGADATRAVHAAEILLNLFRRHDAFAWSFMSSYWHEALAAAKRRAPQLLLAPERLPDDVPPDLDSMVSQADHLGAQVMQLRCDFVEKAFVDAVHKHGIAIWSWPTTSSESIVTSIQAGADGVMGDDTEAAVRLTRDQSPTDVQGEPSPD